MYFKRSPTFWFRTLFLFVLTLNIDSASITNRTLTSQNFCRIKTLSNLSKVLCSSLQNDEKLNDALTYLTKRRVTLELKNLDWDSISLNSFSNISLKTLIIANSTFQLFTNDSQRQSLNLFVRHVSLENLTFHEKPRWEEFSVFRNTKTLFIYNTTLENNITNIFGHHLSKSIESITITECNITEIEPDSFRELKNLTYLRLSYNKLKSFPKLILTKSPKLEQLRLDYNGIHSFIPGAFNNLSHLNVLGLSNNTISTLPEEVFSSVWRTDVSIDLRDNPIKCDCRILWIITSEIKPKDLVGKCAHPKRLHGRNIKDLKLEDLQC